MIAKLFRQFVNLVPEMGRKGRRGLICMAGCWSLLGAGAAGERLQAASFTSAGFLQIPAQAKVGPMSSIAIDRQGNIFVMHRGPQPIAVFDAKGNYVRSFGEGLFKVPHAIKYGPDGNLWTTDNGRHVLRIFSTKGELLRTIGEEDKAGKDEQHFRSPDDIVFAKNGDYYVADAGNNRIVQYRADGSFLRQWGKKGKGPGEFGTAHSLAIDGKGRIYVGDRGNQRIQVFSGTGEFLQEWTGFGNCFGMAIVGKQMLSAEGDTHQLYLLDLKSGAVVDKWGEPDEYQLPHLMAVHKNGTVYLAEVNGKRVQMLRRKR